MPSQLVTKSISAFLLMCAIALPAFAQNLQLPFRSSPRPATTNSVPHIQLGVQMAPVFSSELLQRVARLPGVELRDTVMSLPGAKGFWISESIPLARPDAIVRGREFAHVHPDGSLHAALEPNTARKAVDAGWATPHPWSHRPGWEGFVMLYTPTTASELEVVFALVQDSFSFVTANTTLIQ